MQLSSECATQVGSEFAVSTVEQQLQIKALRTLNACLTASTVDAPEKFEGAPITQFWTLEQYYNTVSSLFQRIWNTVQAFHFAAQYVVMP